jgi:hypothetical protein
MASKEECDRYAVELAQRFENLTQWAISNWPNKEFPLLESDFSASRKELGEILGPKLSSGETSPSSPLDDEAGQYRNVTPAPWP